MSSLNEDNHNTAASDARQSDFVENTSIDFTNGTADTNTAEASDMVDSTIDEGAHDAEGVETETESTQVLGSVGAAMAFDTPVKAVDGDTEIAISSASANASRVIDPSKRTFEQVLPRELRSEILKLWAQSQQLPRTILIVEDRTQPSSFRLSGKLRPDALAISKLSSEDVDALNLYTPMLNLRGSKDVAYVNIDTDTVEIRTAALGAVVAFPPTLAFPHSLHPRTVRDLSTAVVNVNDLALIRRLRVDSTLLMNDYISVINSLRGFTNLEDLTIVITGAVHPGQESFSEEALFVRTGHGFAELRLFTPLLQLSGHDAMNALFQVVVLGAEQRRLHYLFHCLNVAMADPAFLGLVILELTYI